MSYTRIGSALAPLFGFERSVDILQMPAEIPDDVGVDPPSSVHERDEAVPVPHPLSCSESPLLRRDLRAQLALEVLEPVGATRFERHLHDDGLPGRDALHTTGE